MLRELFSYALILGCCGYALASQSADCSTPAILRVTMSGRHPIYKLGNRKRHELFALGEVSDAVEGCSPARKVFVVADFNVPLNAVLLPEKEQITQARYFFRSPDGQVLEMHIGDSYPKLPVSADVHALPDGEEVPPAITRRGHQ